MVFTKITEIHENGSQIPSPRPSQSGDLGIFFTFPEKNHVLWKVELPEKMNSQNRKTDYHVKIYFCNTPYGAKGCHFLISANNCEIHQKSQIIGELLVLSRFKVKFTIFRPKAVTLTWSPEIIEYLRAHLRNYHVSGGIPPNLVNSTISGGIWWIPRFPRFYDLSVVLWCGMFNFLTDGQTRRRRGRVAPRAGGGEAETYPAFGGGACAPPPSSNVL